MPPKSLQEEGYKNSMECELFLKEVRSLTLLLSRENLDSSLTVALQALCVKGQREGEVVCGHVQETGTGYW